MRTRDLLDGQVGIARQRVATQGGMRDLVTSIALAKGASVAWFTRFSRFGDVHFIYGQEHRNSCGPACVMMCVMKLNKLSPGKDVPYVESRMLQAYGQWQKKPYNGVDYGTYPEGLLTILNSFNCGKWVSVMASGTTSGEKIAQFVGVTQGLGPTITTNPIIVGVNWKGNSASHWIVVDSVREFNGKLFATVCDPADANLHVQPFDRNGAFQYDAQQAFAVDLWGDRNSDAYKRPAVGNVQTWPIIRRI